MGTDLTTILVVALVSLTVITCVVLFLIRLAGRLPDRSEYLERCRECNCELSVPTDACPCCGCAFPSAERQGGDSDDGE